MSHSKQPQKNAREITPAPDTEPSRDRDSDEYWTGESAAKAKERSSSSEEAGKVLDTAQKAHPNRVTGNIGRKGQT